MPPGRPLQLKVNDAPRGDPVARDRDAAVSKLCRGALAAAHRALETRAAVAPATTSSAAALTQTTQAFLSTLTPLSAAADVLERGLQLRWDHAASITLPAIALGPAAADWVPEGGPFPHRQYTVSPGSTLYPYKIGTLSSLTGEMMRSSNAEAIIRQNLVDTLGPALDGALFSSAAGVAGLHPAGLLNGVTPITASTATVKSDAMVEDIGALASAVSVVAGKSNIVFVTYPAQATAIGLRSAGTFAYDVLPSNSVSAKTVICIATNALVVALEDQPQIDVSKESSFHRDTSPLPIVSDTGTIATPVGSVFQTDSVALKIRWPIAWLLRDSRGVAFVQNVTW